VKNPFAIPCLSLLEKNYLKTIHNCHACSGTLESSDVDDSDHNVDALPLSLSWDVIAR